ncbi:hypothetical protein [uncultured Stenotrophomonas sp.]|uniref:hypothetical protein n=1 Tax=uncultured Stenotrophomonas sp. TaxID=165438 RepID=UPI0025ED2B4D|nr:hypothetical protein [uncultured Stenotrophomonas sp.]
MLELDKRQEALLRLPEPLGFVPKLAAEIRRDMPERVQGLSEQRLREETERSYFYASYELGITSVPLLVQWTKTDVGSGGELHRNADIDLTMRHAQNPNLKAADILSALAATCRWPKGGH